MTRIIIGEDCGNSPKNVFLQKLTIAFAKGNAKFLLGSVTDDICWNIVGDRQIQGLDRLAEALEELRHTITAELTIRHIATHGEVGAVDGIRTMQDGRILAFCDMYEFRDAKDTRVREITSYINET